MTLEVVYRVSEGRNSDGSVKVIQKKEVITAHSYAGAEEKIKMSRVFREYLDMGMSFSIFSMKRLVGDYRQKLKESRIERESLNSVIKRKIMADFVY